MEVKKVPKQANQFWPYFSKAIYFTVVMSQIAVAGIVTLFLITFQIIVVDSIVFWVTCGLVTLVLLIVNVAIVVYATRPIKDLMAAIIHVSGEKGPSTPPNPNTKRNEKTGFKDALQTIYELSSGNTKTDNSLTTTKTSLTDVNSALDMTTSGFVAFDSRRNIIYANKAAPVHTNTDGKTTLDLLFNGKNTLDAWLDDCSEHAVHAENIWTRVPDRLPNQENRRFFDVMASYQKGANPETVLTLIDRTSTYIVDEESLDFIAFAAHELRGPITVIRGYLDVLNDELDSVLQDDQHELFRRLIVSSNRLSGYINNILNTSRFDRRHLKVHLVEDSLANIYDMISDDMQLRAGSQNRLLAVHIPADLPTIAVDRASMSEVLGNLIDNAIKYSNEGGAVNVTAKLAGNFVEIAVEDHGIGMPESVVSQLFQKFYRSHRSRETVAGTGIGLYISKAIVESHGGNISVRSEDGRGSTFTVSIPTYASVADKLKSSDNSNEGLISAGNGWIKNHSMYRG